MKAFRASLVAVAVCGFGGTLHAELANGIMAVVHDSVITFQEVDANTALVAEELKRQYRSQPDVYDKKLNEKLNETLDRLLERQLILHDFATGGYSLPESVIDDIVQERIRARFGGDRATLTKTLQAQGITYEKFRQQQRDQFIVEQMRYRNIAGELIISPHRIETYYLAHKDDYKVEDEIKLRMIVLNKLTASDAAQVRKLAGEIVAKIKEGAAFAEMANVYSQGNNPGGDWGWVERRVLRKELAEVAFSLKSGDLSDIIDTPEAIYLMLVEEKRPAHVKALSEVRDEIEKAMLTQEHERLQRQYIERLRKKTYVRLF